MITQQDMNVLCRSALFEGYSPLALAAALETLGARRRTFGPGEVLADESSPADWFGLVVEGYLHLYDSAFKGHRHLMRIVGRGQSVGVTLIVAQRTHVPALLMSHGKSVVISFSLHCVCRAQKAGLEPRFFANLNVVTAEVLSECWRKISILSCPNIAERVLLYLHERSERERSKTFAIGSTEAEFADYLGVNRTALARVLHQLEKEGRFTHKRDVFTLA